MGDEAPDFTLVNQHREPVTLSSFRGRAVVLVFYPMSFTGVCTGELRELRDHVATFQNESVQLIAVSCDNVPSQRVFADQEGLDYPLLADFWPHGAVAQAYGVFDDEVGFPRRATFIIDKAGIVRWKVLNAISDARDIADYQRALASL
ncbi:MAG: mycoredoxin-dependent peroxiredoxin [Frankiales bacterium]|nr:mycoredoxin-dependent peroxiredoxin [Frankiales bacterium]